jgi:dihydrofolate reductase
MRRIVVSEFVSLDGVMEDPGGAEGYKHGGWIFKFQDPQGGKYKLDEVMEHEALLLGRVTYEGFAAAWPGRTDEAGFAGKKLFGEQEALTELRLADAKPLQSGTVILTYHAAADAT